MKLPLILFAATLVLAPAARAAAPLKVLIIDGQNNHDWRATTPHLKRQLETSARFTVEVARGGRDPCSEGRLPGLFRQLRRARFHRHQRISEGD